MNKVERYLKEIDIRRQNLETKRQVQLAENDKELEILRFWENSLEAIRIEKENENE